MHTFHMICQMVFQNESTSADLAGVGSFVCVGSYMPV